MATSSPPRGPGRPPRSAEARAAQRTRLVDAAMDAIRAHGPDVSVDDMAAAAGVSKPVLYAEFGDKVGIGEAIAVVLGERGEREVIEEMSRGGRLEMRAALSAAINRFMDIVIDEPEIYAFILRSIRTSDKGLLDNALIRTLEGRFQQVAAVLVPAADPDLVDVIAAGTFGFILASVESWRETGRPDRREVVDQLATVLVAGFAAAGGPPVGDGAPR
ncbi:MAG: TetR/AcrR family transcriptional regulator [Acidimicrobiales bacterium]